MRYQSNCFPLTMLCHLDKMTISSEAGIGKEQVFTEEALKSQKHVDYELIVRFNI